jgi:hypothetical protein
MFSEHRSGDVVSAFEFFFGFFSLIMGLAVATVASGLADVLRARKVVPIGWLTPLLALLILLDISTFWVTGWTGLQNIEITYSTIYTGLVIALVYFLAAAMVFPRDASEWPSLDDYYDSHKRLVIGGILFSNTLGLLSRLVLGDRLAGFETTRIILLALFFGLLIALLFVRNRKLNIALLALHCVVNVAPAFLI